jgi:hypothetical protein
LVVQVHCPLVADWFEEESVLESSSEDWHFCIFFLVVVVETAVPRPKTRRLLFGCGSYWQESHCKRSIGSIGT